MYTRNGYEPLLAAAYVRGMALNFGIPVLPRVLTEMPLEGLYIKIEEVGQVVDRLKFVRASFTQTVDASQTHWLDRPIIPNRLSRPVDDLSSGCPLASQDRGKDLRWAKKYVEGKYDA